MTLGRLHLMVLDAGMLIHHHGATGNCSSGLTPGHDRSSLCKVRSKAYHQLAAYGLQNEEVGQLTYMIGSNSKLIKPEMNGNVSHDQLPGDPNPPPPPPPPLLLSFPCTTLLALVHVLSLCTRFSSVLQLLPMTFSPRVSYESSVKC